MHRVNLTFVSGAPLPVRGRHHVKNVCGRPTMTAAAASHTLDGKTISGPLQPVGQNILVKVAESPDTTSGGLFLAASAKEKPTYGEAIEVGPGKTFPNGIQVPMKVEKGDYVLYGKYGGTDLDYDGDKHTIVTQDDILCKLENGEYSATAVQPIQDRMLIKVDEAAEETSSGIILSKTAKTKSTSGKIVAMGPGRFMENGQMEPLAFSIGDTVFYGKYSGMEVEFGGEQYMMIRMVDVYAKL
ncbi:GroES chaperonin [Gracilaria domingensis]|nr:GroES chaperonin [Gracilaria domingensis]